MANIKYFGFAKSSSTFPVFGICQEKGLQDDVKIQIGKVLNQLKSLNMRVEERQKIKSANGCWYCKKDAHEVIYVVLCSPNYPERHIFAAINQLRDHLQKLGDYQTEPESTLKLHAKSIVQQICVKYENLKGIDKIAEVNDTINTIKESARQSTGKIINNAIQLQELERKSETLKAHAMQFSESATELQRLMYWRNCKLKIIIGVIIVCIICFIVVPIVTRNTT